MDTVGSTVPTLLLEPSQGDLYRVKLIASDYPKSRQVSLSPLTPTASDVELTVICIERVDVQRIKEIVKPNRHWPGVEGDPCQWLCICAELGYIVVGRSLLGSAFHSTLLVPFSDCE